MSTKTITIKNQEVKFEDLVSFILSRQKLQGIHFLKTNLKLDLRDSKEAVEAMNAGQHDKAYQILLTHSDCSTPVYQIDGRSNQPAASPKNPFLIEENKTTNAVKLILFLAIGLLILGAAIVYFMSANAK